MHFGKYHTKQDAKNVKSSNLVLIFVEDDVILCRKYYLCTKQQILYFL